MPGKSLLRYSVIACAIVASSGAQAAGGLGLTAKAGTLGLGIEATTSFTDTLNARLGYQAFTYNTDIDIESTTSGTVKMDTDIDLSNVSLLLDWHAFDGTFRFSGGIMSNNSKAKASAPVDSYEIGGITYPGIGLDTEVEFKNKPAPYLGIGWGNAVGKDKRWVFSADLGVLFQGSPDVSLTPTGPGAGLVDPGDVANEEARIEDDLKKFQYYPVASVGISYHF